MLRFFFCTMLLFSLVACTDSTNSNSSSDNNGGGAAANDGTHVSASDIAPFIGLWSYSVAVSNDIIRQESYEGRWIALDGDMNFTSGIWGDQTNKGTYSYNKNSQIISLDYADDSKDADMDWGIQHGGGEVMIWKGNSGRNTAGDQIRMQMVQERPQRPAGE